MKSIKDKYNRKESGFTLIELLVVIAVISMLASIVIASLKSAKDKSISAAVNASARSFYEAMLQYSFDKGGFLRIGSPLIYTCMADYPDDKCGIDNFISENATVKDAIRPYLSNLTPPPVVIISSLPNEGPIYLSSASSCETDSSLPGVCGWGIMVWYVYDNSSKCGFAGHGTPQSGVIMCRVMFASDGKTYPF